MPVITPVAGKMPLAKRLCEAVGVTCPVERLVIEVDAGKLIRVYVKVPLDAAVVAELATLFETEQVAAVEVGADTAITVTPLEAR